jgi:predicted phage tail protein
MLKHPSEITFLYYLINKPLASVSGFFIGVNMQVTIDGVPYAPACASSSRIGIAVTTHNAYADVMEPVFEQALVARYGFNQLEMTAIGCTRQSEANRKGRWGVLTNNKDRIVSFDVGLDGNIPQPGYIIAVADEMLSGKVMGGRISAVNGRVITLDREADGAAGDRLILNLPSGASQSRTIQAVNGKAITVTTAYSETPQAEAVWVVESEELYAQQYRVVSVKDNNDGTFSIAGAWHDPDKYARIDTGAIIDQRPVSVIPPGNQSPPANIVISSFSVVQQNISVETMRVSWDQAQNAIAYEAQWRRNNGNWINVPRSSTTSFDVPGIYAGRYLVRVRAINAAEISSGWGYSEEKTLTGKVGNPPKPVGFIASENVVFGIELNWGFPENTEDTLKTEIQYSLTGSEDDAILLADVPYPARKYQQMGLKAGQIFWYRAQLVDRTGNESGYTDWVRGQASIDVSDITDVILDEIKESETFKDLIESAVDSNEKIAGMADDIKQNADELEQQALAIQENTDGLAQAAVKIDEISVSMDGMTGGVKNSSIAVIQNSLAQVTSRRSQTATNNGNVAKIDRIDTTIADTSQAVARALVTLDASAGGNISSATDLTETLADFTHASATKINSLTVTVNGQTAAINQTAQAVADVNGNLNAMYNIKVAVDANGRQYAAGMGIGVQNTPSGMQSQVLFVADRFAVMAQAGGSVSLPFVIQNGQTFIRDTFIQDGTISNAKIGNFIQSNNYLAGSAGWSIPKNGSPEFNSGTFRGALYATSGNFGFTGNNGVVINGSGVTVNLAGGGRIVLGEWS